MDEDGKRINVARNCTTRPVGMNLPPMTTTTGFRRMLRVLER